MSVTVRLSVLLAASLLIVIIQAQAKIPDSIGKLYHQQVITPNQVVLRAPAIAENGAVVSITIDGVQNLPDGVHVDEIRIFSQFRNEPVAIFRLTPKLSAKELTTRIKLAESGWIFAIATLSNGKLVSGEAYVKVTLGGCGGGGYTDHSGSTIYHSAPPPGAGYSHNLPLAHLRYPPLPHVNTEKYAHLEQNTVIETRLQPVSTFSIDVDTGSYANVRRFLNNGSLPLADAVRVEEMINYFSYDYAMPADKSRPFTINTEIGPTPWNRDTHILQIGLQGYKQRYSHLPPANLVFLIDVSGSMAGPNKLNLLIPAMQLLVKQLRPEDHLGIVVYAGASGVVLEPTSGVEKTRIRAALARLTAGGSTNGGAGIQLAYALARQYFKPDGINRVILATDGDFNVGVVNYNQLIDLIEKQRNSGIALTTLGFGTGNYNDQLMEQLADKGNGNYAYIDNMQEASKVLVEQLSGTLFTIASDVKIQVEFNPAVVAEYRLIGYENRMLRREDFNNDKVDAGDIGAGHSVTALYEVTFNDSKIRRLEPLRYGNKTIQPDVNDTEIAEVRLRYKQPGAATSDAIRNIIHKADVQNTLHTVSDNYRFATAVAAFAQRLKGGKFIGAFNFKEIEEQAQSAMTGDSYGHRDEFLQLVRTASDLTRNTEVSINTTN